MQVCFLPIPGTIDDAGVSASVNSLKSTCAMGLDEGADLGNSLFRLRAAPTPPRSSSQARKQTDAARSASPPSHGRDTSLDSLLSCSGHEREPSRDTNHLPVTAGGTMRILKLAYGGINGSGYIFMMHRDITEKCCGVWGAVDRPGRFLQVSSKAVTIRVIRATPQTIQGPAPASAGISTTRTACPAVALPRPSSLTLSARDISPVLRKKGAPLRRFSPFPCSRGTGLALAV